MIPLLIIVGYLCLLIVLGVFAGRLFRGTGRDYMLASHTIGPVLLLMSLFGTTMTAFALVGSTGESYRQGIIVYGLMASPAGIVHSACFFLLGPKLWSFGKRYGYTTQIQFFRDRLQNEALGLLLFPILVSLVVVYLLMGVISAGTVVDKVTGVPAWLGSAGISAVVLVYVFFGGMRATAWANTFQTTVFMVLGMVTFLVIAGQLGGPASAIQAVMEKHPEKLDTVRTAEGQLKFMSYLLIPLSVGMFPHVFQHWLTARRASAFKLPIIAHPIFVLIVWLPCVLIGAWATSAQLNGQPVVPSNIKDPNAVLSLMVDKLTQSDVLTGLLSAGVLAAIMSSLDSQFLCIGSMFTKDIVQHYWPEQRFSEKQTVWLARGFVVAIVVVTYALSLVTQRSVFALGIWCFSGFTGLFPLVLAAVYWRRLTAAGAFACVVTVLISWGYMFWQSGFGGNRGYDFLGLMPIVVIAALSTVVMVAVSLLTKPPGEATLAKYF